MKYYLKILAKKKETISYIKNNGEIIPATVLLLYPPFLTDVKEINADGDVKVNFAFKILLNKRKITKSMYCFFEKRHLLPMEQILTSRLNQKLIQKLINDQALDRRYKLLRMLRVENLNIKVLDIQARTKGLGFTGTIKRFGFKQGPKSHGSKSHRRPGSIGAGTTPGRVLKNKRMAGHKGNILKTLKNINILSKEGHKLIISNSIAGKNNSEVILKIQI